MAILRKPIRSSRFALWRGSRLLPTLLTVGALALGPLAIVAYACSDGGEPSAGTSAGTVVSMGGGHGGGSGTRTPTSPATTPPSAGGVTSPGTVNPPATKPPATKPPATNPPSTNPGTGTPAKPGTGTGTTTQPQPGGGSNPGPSADGVVDDGAGEDTNAAPATGDGAGAVTPDSPAPTTPGGTVTAQGGDGKHHTSKGKIDSSSPKSSGTAGRAVNSIQASAAPVGVAVKPILNAIVSSGESDGDKSSGGSAAKREASKRQAVERRTTIARAVDGIPLAFRGALLALIFATSILAVVSFRERRRAVTSARVAQLDHLTGLANREGFDRQMSIEWQRALRHGRPLGLVFVDLDHFKAFNDTHGHVAGDRLLREVAAAITTTARGSDFTARLGGDEFVVLCPDTDESGLDRLIERLRVEAAGMAVTLSIGAAGMLESDESSDDLVHRADVAMYQSKGGHRRGAGSANPMLGSMRRA